MALLWFVLVAGDTSSSAMAQDTLAVVRPRAVLQLEQMVVHGPRAHDPLSSETVHIIASDRARALPLDRTTELVGLQAGVVARGEDLHVRGGRTGETREVLHGITLNEPLRGRPLELPLIGMREIELASGGLDADLGGALAGVVSYRPHESRAFEGELTWKTDASGWDYDRLTGRAGGPLGGTGLGAVVSVEAALDDTNLPSLRTESRRRLLGGALGWRADNHLLGYARLYTLGAAHLALDLIANRRVERPFDPMWSVDGYTAPCDDPLCVEGPVFSPTPQPGYARYRAADHLAITDTRDFAGVLSFAKPYGPWLMHAAAGLTWSRSITSLDGREDASYLVPGRYPQFGIPDSPKSEPFYVYGGDEPFFRRRLGQRWEARVELQRSAPSGQLFKTGAGLTYEHAALRELDLSVSDLDVDSLRTYRIWAPGGYAYVHGRWAFEGLVANGGLRLEAFTAGPQAADQTFGQKASTVWSLSPRLGVSFPISVHSALSFSYTRVTQNPERDFLYDNRERPTNRQPVGQPALVPATGVSYQAAVKHVFDPTWSAQAVIFYRDLWNVVGARNVTPRNDVAQLRYESTENGSASGIEVSVSGVTSLGFAELHYTYLDARGTMSGEEGVPYGPLTTQRPESIGPHPLDWDRRHTITAVLHREWANRGAFSATMFVGSGLPWTPRARRQLDTDLSRENSERLRWEENTSIAAQLDLPWLRNVILGIEILNLFDDRSEIAVTTDGYPNPLINTLFDDYGAYRTETGKSGGAYWNDSDGDGVPGWRPVGDPRLFQAPRTVRLSMTTRW